MRNNERLIDCMNKDIMPTTHYEHNDENTKSTHLFFHQSLRSRKENLRNKQKTFISSRAEENDPEFTSSQ